MNRLPLCSRIIAVAVMTLSSISFGQDIPTTTAGATAISVKREFRGAWIATVLNLDWPPSPGSDPLFQKLQLNAILDSLKNTGINAVLFQVRSECDAMYASPFEPWSFRLTGFQGGAGSYDPLQFVIDQAHKRGLELHAWFNPYRAVRSVGEYSIHPTHVTVQHPEWVITLGTLKVLNPGLQQVRDYITSVIMDVVRRYDIDGVHFDDYFYPYPPTTITTQDDSTFASYNRGISSKADWRRDNVHLLIKEISDSVRTTKSHIKFGISPFGIWKNGVPSGITGLSAYDDIFCDALMWLSQRWIDYLAPQLYWQIGGPQDYNKLMPWWATQMNGRHLYPGQAAYRINSWSSSELPNQIRLNRSNPNVQGSIFFRANNGIIDNLQGFKDSLRLNLFRYPALLPVMAWKDSIAPNPPQNLRFGPIAGTSPAGLQWDGPTPASDGDTATRYVVYRFTQPPTQPSDLDDPSKIVAITAAPSSVPKTIPPSSSSYYVVTTLDRNHNESGMSNTLMVSAPVAPLLAGPANGSTNLKDSVTAFWNSSQLASSYQLQVSADSTFTTSTLLDVSIPDTFRVVSGLLGQKKYYWRVNAANAGGTSGFSGPWSFRTGFPEIPLLAFPSNFSDTVAINPTLKWFAAQGASSYQLQVSKSQAFDSASIVTNISNLTDTTYSLVSLQGYTIYFWRLTATNTIGISDWSPIWRFRTQAVTLVLGDDVGPQNYSLSQNYPNPFNPVTNIEISVPRYGRVVIRVYDVLGRSIASLVDEELAPGLYTFRFDGTALPSGMYLYVMNVGETRIVKKMMLLK